MSLRVWFPFNGHSNNQGASSVQITDTITFNNNGKIGQCLESTDQLNLNIPQSIYDVYSVNNTEITYSLWFKIDKAYLNSWISTADFSSKTQMYNKIIGFASGSTSNGLDIHIRTVDSLTNSTVLNQVYVSGCLRNGTTYKVSTEVLIDLDKWYHAVVSYNKNNYMAFYLNGTFISGATVTRGTTNTSITTRTVRLNTPYCYLGSTSSNTKHLLPLKEYFNDVRIYDHALSSAEVHEISQGLVLHYKLDRVPNGEITNAFNMSSWNTNTTRGGFNSWGASGHKGTYGTNTNRDYIYYPHRTYSYWVANGSDSTPLTYLFYQSPAFEGGYRSLQCILKEENGEPITENIIRPSWNANVAGEGHAPAAKWSWVLSLGKGFYLCKVNGLYQDGSNDLVGLSVTRGHKVYISEIWLENNKEVCSEVLFSNNIIQDNSGYGYNGTIVGNPLIVSDTPRYSSSMSFNGTTDAVNCGKAFNVEGATEMTWSGWFNCDSWRTSGWQYLLSSQEAGGIVLTKYNTCTVRARAQAYTAADKSTRGYINADYETTTTDIPAGSSWHMITGVYTTSAIKLYIDGILKKTTSTTTYGIHFYSGANMFIGAESGGTNPDGFATCKASDIRVYYTALSDADVKQLYELGAKIDNKQNLHIYEGVEAQSAIKLTQQGQMETNEFQENTNTKLYQSTLNIDTNNLIEI